MSNDDYTQLPVIVLSGLEGNDPTRLGPIQEGMAPYADALIGVWGIIFCITISVVVFRGVLMPIFFSRS